MTALITIDELKARLPCNVLPLDAEGNIDEARINLALKDATGIIVSKLHWLIDSETKDIVKDIPATFEYALKAICADIALIRLNDIVTSNEDTHKKYDASMSLLNEIDKEYQGSLSGPGLQNSEIVDESTDKTLIDKRYFKKGMLI